MSLSDIIADYHEDIPLLFMTPNDCYDKAIIGVVEGKGIEPKVAYDYNKVIQANIDMGMSYDEVVEYFEFNQVDAYVGDHTPVFIRKYHDENKWNLRELLHLFRTARRNITRSRKLIKEGETK